MQVDIHGFLGGRRLLIAVVAAVALLAALSSRAEAQIDISGDWNISFEGAFSGTCTAAIQQTGSDLFGAVDCTTVGSGILSGSIDPATGALALSGSLMGFTLGLDGIATPDGDSFSGTWEVPSLGFSGTFTGTRTDSTPSLVDLSGDWDIVLFGDLSATCTASITQSLAELIAAMACTGLGSGSFSGTVNPLAGTFDLSGSLDGSGLQLAGSVGGEPQLMEGTWSAFDRDLFGNFIGAGAGELASGVMVVDCNAEGPSVQTDCGYPQEASFQAQIYVAAPPAEGYTGFQAKLQWTEGILQYLPSPDPLDEALWPPCVIPERSAVDGSSVVFGCMPEPAEGDTFTGAVVQFQMQCQENGTTGVDLVPRASDPQQGTHFLGAQGNPVDPVLISATVTCFGPPGLPGPDDLRGDFPVGRPSPAPTEAPAPTATPSPKALALPSTGGGPSEDRAAAGGTRLPLMSLLGLGAALLVAGVWGLRLRQES